ncbi:hypothetical protein LX64_00704 [Chitinophaga skermanii]|uniref:Uncharacterized protein n=1 Tax=Chitinophaga skermanii TaxID=331697 RepID=A0A327R2P9_9BACT|nr:hypothetical protein [Chitinophaga skermanii]RAJ11096.1 hypothetical protein LX64_00704 [Chitinophaga skermanii]
MEFVLPLHRLIDHERQHLDKSFNQASFTVQDVREVPRSITIKLKDDEILTYEENTSQPIVLVVLMFITMLSVAGVFVSFGKAHIVQALILTSIILGLAVLLFIQVLKTERTIAYKVTRNGLFLSDQFFAWKALQEIYVVDREFVYYRKKLKQYYHVKYIVFHQDKAFRFFPINGNLQQLATAINHLRPR